MIMRSVNLFSIFRFVPMILILIVVLVVFFSLPPKQIVIETGPPTGFFDRTAHYIQQKLWTYGIEAKIKNTLKTISIVEHVNDINTSVDVGFVAQDLSNQNIGNVSSLGSIMIEPLFAFYRRELNLASPKNLKGLTIAMGPKGGGTRVLAANLLNSFGVNEKNLKSSDQIISAASCTTNCLAPVAKVVNDNFGIERGFMTTIHSYTTDQRLLDNSHKDLRRARSAANSMIPTTTGATKSLGDVIPGLKDKVEGISIRVPTPNVSLVEFVFSSKKDLSIEELNNSLIKASKGKLKNILDTSSKQLVSSDFNHNPHSAIVDLSLTNVTDGKMAKVSAWYDNEWGFACRMCDLANYLGKI